MAGSGASPKGDFPFLDRFNLETSVKDRLFHCEAPYYETAVEFLNDNKTLLLTRRESVDEPANYFIRDLKNNTTKQITHFEHPYPQLKKVKKEQIRYDREDGVTMTAELLLPPGYSADNGTLPMIVWAYPREFKNAKDASQVTGSPYRFNYIGATSIDAFLSMGYAILDGPTMPIIGEGEEEPNDNYVKQLVMSAKAAVDEVVRRGVTKRGKIAIGWHSYGAFMAVNLLAHSELFACGIARSGAYNRSLTPFGFQS